MSSGMRVSLKAEKERLEQQVKAMSAPPTGFVPHLPHPTAFHPTAFAPFTPQHQAPANKSASIPTAFPGMAMWQWRHLEWQCGSGCRRPSWTQLQMQSSGRRMLRCIYHGILTHDAISSIANQNVGPGEEKFAICFVV
jgi:hypothetical protein